MSFISPIAIPPGETIKDSLEYEKMTQKELALRLGMSEKHLVSILSGKSPVTAEVAQKLEKIIGGSAQFWLNTENSYQLSKLRLEDAKKKRGEVKKAKKFTCYGEIAKAGFVKASRKWEEKTEELLRFFKLPDFDNIYSLFPEVTYRNADDDIQKESLISWLRCGDILAEKQELQKYDRKKLESFIPRFKELTSCSGEFDKTLKDLCAEAGVAVVFVPYFKNTKVNGATRWIRKNKNPLIQLNTKGASSDIFWFTFFHELGHVLLHGKTERFLESANIVNIDSTKEKEADNFAEETLISRKEFEEFSERFTITSENIRINSKKWNIHPSIVRGRLAKKGIIKYSQFQEHCIRLKMS